MWFLLGPASLPFFPQLSVSLYCSGILISVYFNLANRINVNYICGLSLTLITYITLTKPCSILSCDQHKGHIAHRWGTQIFKHYNHSEYNKEYFEPGTLLSTSHTWTFSSTDSHTRDLIYRKGIRVTNVTGSRSQFSKHGTRFWLRSACPPKPVLSCCNRIIPVVWNTEVGASKSALGVCSCCAWEDFTEERISDLGTEGWSTHQEQQTCDLFSE